MTNKTIDFSELFPDKRLNDKTDLKRAQLVMLRMLNILDYLCRENNVEYWLDFGTLLGAVRHKGFVPWDGDMDIGMTRENYNKFIKTCVPYLPHDIFFQNAQTDLYYPAGNVIEAKLRDKYSNYIEWQQQNPDIKWHNGIQVDIFIYDKWLSRDKSMFEIQKKIIIRSLFCKKILNFFYKMVKVKHYAVIEGVFFNVEDVFPLKTLEFENFLAPVPNDYNKYLRNYYGDYMKLPPENERHPHEGKIAPISPCNHKEILYWDKN